MSSIDQGGENSESLSGRRLDQAGQRCVHRVVEIGVGESAVQPQTRDNTVKEDTALLDRHPVGGAPDDPKLRVGQGEHDLEKLSREPRCLNRELDHSVRAHEPNSMNPTVTMKKIANSAMDPPFGSVRSLYYDSKCWLSIRLCVLVWNKS
jgi:hypothetical protein